MRDMRAFYLLLLLLLPYSANALIQPLGNGTGSVSIIEVDPVFTAANSTLCQSDGTNCPSGLGNSSFNQSFTDNRYIFRTGDIVNGSYVFLENVSVGNNLGVGFTGFSSYPLHVLTARSGILAQIETTSTNLSYLVIGNQLRDYALGVTSGSGDFSIIDTTTGNSPFYIDAGSQNNQLYLENDGDVGFGTSTPSFDLHVVRSSSWAIGAFETTDSGSGAEFEFITPLKTWKMQNRADGNFSITDGSTQRVTINGDGEVGIGTNDPLDNLHLFSTQATVRYTNSDATADYWRLGLNPNEDFVINHRGDAMAEFIIDQGNNITAFQFGGSGAHVGINMAPSSVNTSVALDVSGTTRTDELYIGGVLACRADGTNCPGTSAEIITQYTLMAESFTDTNAPNAPRMIGNTYFQRYINLSAYSEFRYGVTRGTGNGAPAYGIFPVYKTSSCGTLTLNTWTNLSATNTRFNLSVAGTGIQQSSWESLPGGVDEVCVGFGQDGGDSLLDPQLRGLWVDVR